MYKKYGKRIFDCIAAVAGLVILLPVLLILACLIHKKLGNPVFFRQMRPGKGGKIFNMYKFRSMTDERDSQGELLPDALRLTDFGRRLRASSLDELPELINILKGDMSVVGPRPQLVRDMVFFNEDQMSRQNVYPGLTGLAQVNGRNNITWEAKLQYDLQYIKDITFSQDFRIIYRTVFKVARHEGISAAGMDTAEDYGDYLLRIGKISVPEYSANLEKAKRMLGELAE